MTAQSSQRTWVIATPVRRVLRNRILELRALLEDDFRRQLAAYGIREGGVQSLPTGRTLAPPDQHARDVALAIIQREQQGGASHADALTAYARDSAFTFL